MDEFEQRPREAARAILERHGWKRPMTAELKEMREAVGLPYTECKRYLVEEWQDMRVPLLEKENAELRELVQRLYGSYYIEYPDAAEREFASRLRVRVNEYGTIPDWRDRRKTDALAPLVAKEDGTYRYSDLDEYHGCTVYVTKFEDGMGIIPSWMEVE